MMTVNLKRIFPIIFSFQYFLNLSAVELNFKLKILNFLILISQVILICLGSFSKQQTHHGISGSLGHPESTGTVKNVLFVS